MALKHRRISQIWTRSEAREYWQKGEGGERKRKEIVRTRDRKRKKMINSMGNSG